eukprot:231750-Chlamydomonas_euryale.AAC.3
MAVACDHACTSAEASSPCACACFPSAACDSSNSSATKRCSAFITTRHAERLSVVAMALQQVARARCEDLQVNQAAGPQGVFHSAGITRAL